MKKKAEMKESMGMKRFWAEEAKEKEHKDIKKVLEKKAKMKVKK